jgi:hypothetical protein
MKKTYFIVGLELPDGMNKTRLREYIKTAIRGYIKKCVRDNYYRPNDDFFNINTDNLSIVPMSDNAYKHFFSGKEKKE